MSDSRRAARARAHLAERDPALGLLSLWCLHRDHAGQTETDGDTIRYGPDFDTAPLADQVGLVAHHVLHVALRHSARSGGMRQRLGSEFDAPLFDAVTDAIVNETLHLADHALPRPCVMLTELLAASGLPATDPHGALADWDAEHLYAALRRDPDKAASARKYAQGQGFKQDVVPSENGAVAPDEDTAWRAHLVRAMAAGEGAGQGIGPVLSQIAAFAPPRIPWERELRRLLTRATLPKPMISWSRPARRWVAQVGQGADVPFEPARRSHTPCGRVVVALDSSSSVDGAQWQMFGAELRGVLRRSGAECILLGFDEAVHFEQHLTAQAGLDQVQMRRGGGTDFVPVFARAVELNPSVFVVLSDGDARMPPPPDFDVVWVMPEVMGDPPEFGRVLVME